MDKAELTETDFTPLKRPDKPKETKHLEKTKYLDDLYSAKWLDEYFDSKERPKTS